MARNVKDPRNPKKYQAVPRNPKKYQAVPRNPKSPKSPRNPRKNPRKIEILEIILTVIKQNKLLPTSLCQMVTKINCDLTN